MMPIAVERFDPKTLFGQIARTLAEAECLPQKELFEAWEVAKRTQRRLRGRGVRRVVDLACGHGVAGAVLALIEPRIAEVVGVDRRLPPCAKKSLAAMTARFPQLGGRVSLIEGELRAVEVRADDLVVCVHGCGALTDVAIDRAIAGRAMVAVLPCCHKKRDADTGGLEGWCDFALAIDVRRAERLRAAGFRVVTQKIPEEITPKNRLLIGVPK